MKDKLTIFVFCITIIFLTCGDFKRNAVGNFNAISVVISLEDWVELKDELRNTFEKELQLPQPEKSFELHRTMPEEWEKRKRDRNIIFISTLYSKGPIKDFIERMLTPEIKKGVEEEKYFYFLKEDVWANNQAVLILIAENIETLKNKIKNNKEALFGLMYQKVLKWAKVSIYDDGYKEKLSKELLEKYNFTFKIPEHYYIATEDSVNNFFWIRRWNPDRMIAVYFENAIGDYKITKEWVLNKRDSLSMKYMDGSEIDRENSDFSSEFVSFLGRRTHRLTGLWKIERKILGGPFINYSFYDEKTGKIFMIDLSVFNPNITSSRKLPYLLQLETIARTFEITNK